MTEIYYRASQDASQDVVAALVARARPVSDGKGERADVVRDHAVRHVLAPDIVRAHLSKV